MKIVFIGSSRFGFRCLQNIFEMSSCVISGIVTNRKTFSISYSPEAVKNVLHADIIPFANQHNIPIFIMEEKMTDPKLVEAIRNWAPDLILVVGWYHMVPKTVRDIALTVGMHASLLPDYSGGAPLVWAMINGEKRTGITLFKFADGVDNGPIIGQKVTDILAEDTIATLYARIEDIGVGLLEDHLPRIADGTSVLIPQDESKRRIFPQRSPEDGRINWNLPASRIYDFIRAQTHPYPGAFTGFNGRKVYIWKSRQSLIRIKTNNLSGSFCKSGDNEIVVVCGQDTALILELVSDGTHEMSAMNWFLSKANCIEGRFS